MVEYKIFLKKKTNKGNISRDESFITAGKMVTRHSNPADTFRIWKEKAQKGEAVSYKRGILIEYFVDKSPKEIKDHVIKEMEILKKKLIKEMEINWEVEKC